MGDYTCLSAALADYGGTCLSSTGFTCLSQVTSPISSSDMVNFFWNNRDRYFRAAIGNSNNNGSLRNSSITNYLGYTQPFVTDGYNSTSSYPGDYSGSNQPINSYQTYPSFTFNFSNGGSTSAPRHTQVTAIMFVAGAMGASGTPSPIITSVNNYSLSATLGGRINNVRNSTYNNQLSDFSVVYYYLNTSDIRNISSIQTTWLNDSANRVTCPGMVLVPGRWTEEQTTTFRFDTQPIVYNDQDGQYRWFTAGINPYEIGFFFGAANFNDTNRSFPFMDDTNRRSPFYRGQTSDSSADFEDVTNYDRKWFDGNGCDSIVGSRYWYNAITYQMFINRNSDLRYPNWTTGSLAQGWSPDYEGNYTPDNTYFFQNTMFNNFDLGRMITRFRFVSA